VFRDRLQLGLHEYRGVLDGTESPGGALGVGVLIDSAFPIVAAMYREGMNRMSNANWANNTRVHGVGSPEP